MLGAYRGRELAWVGNVGTGFTERDIDELLAKLEPLRTDTRAVPRGPEDAEGAQGRRRLGGADSSSARSSSPSGRTTGICARRRSRVCATTSRRATCGARSRSRRTEGRVKLSNLDKVFFADEGITKGDLLDYYRAVAPVLVPHLRDRPFTMRRYPDGAEGKAFFQKDAPSHMPEWIPRFRVQVSTREAPRRTKWIEAPVVNDEDALLWMVNMGCIDMNTWYSRVDKPDRPDFVLFDLDPSPDVGFKETVQVALIVKQALDALGLVSFPKTSSADGMHVLVPVERRYTFDDTREFSEIVAGAIARAHRGLATTEWTKSKRRGVLIDSNQNGEGKTIASVYSVRPRPGAPVSTPLRWDEVNEQLDPPCVHDGRRARADPQARRPLRRRADDAAAARQGAERAALTFSRAARDARACRARRRRGGREARPSSRRRRGAGAARAAAGRGDSSASRTSRGSRGGASPSTSAMPL